MKRTLVIIGTAVTLLTAATYIARSQKPPDVTPPQLVSKDVTLRLSWEISEPVDAFRVYWAKVTDEEEQYSSLQVGGDAREASVTVPANQATVFYVSSVVGEIESELSEPVYWTSRPPRPTGVQITAVTATFTLDDSGEPVPPVVRTAVDLVVPSP